LTAPWIDGRITREVTELGKEKTAASVLFFCGASAPRGHAPHPEIALGGTAGVRWILPEPRTNHRLRPRPGSV